MGSVVNGVSAVKEAARRQSRILMEPNSSDARIAVIRRRCHEIDRHHRYLADNTQRGRCYGGNQATNL